MSATNDEEKGKHLADEVSDAVAVEAAKQNMDPTKAGKLAAQAVKDAGGSDEEAAKAAARRRAPAPSSCTDSTMRVSIFCPACNSTVNVPFFGASTVCSARNFIAGVFQPSL